MTSHDKAFERLLELGNPTERWTRNELLDRALRTTLTLTDADAVIILSSPRGREERIALHNGSSVLAVLQPPPEGSEVIRSLVQSGQPLLVPDLSEQPQFAGTDSCPGLEAGPVIFSPLRQRNLAPSYLAAYRRRGRAQFATHDIRSILLLGAWLNAALENLRLSTSRERLAVTDDLTNVYNLRFLKVALGREIRRAHRFGHAVSIAKIDVDDLDPGSGESDGPPTAAFLGEVAMVLAREVRSFDILGKYDRDKLMLLLPQTSREGAVEVAERARAAVQRHSFSLGDAGTITLSVGVASSPQDGSDVEKLMAAADRALQKALEQGRNCVATVARRAA